MDKRKLSETSKSKPRKRTKKMRADNQRYVETILDERMNANGVREFLLLWEGLPLDQTAWEPESNVHEDLIDQWDEDRLAWEYSDDEGDDDGDEDQLEGQAPTPNMSSTVEPSVTRLLPPRSASAVTTPNTDDESSNHDTELQDEAEDEFGASIDRPIVIDDSSTDDETDDQGPMDLDGNSIDTGVEDDESRLFNNSSTDANADHESMDLDDARTAAETEEHESVIPDAGNGESRQHPTPLGNSSTGANESEPELPSSITGSVPLTTVERDMVELTLEESAPFFDDGYVSQEEIDTVMSVDLGMKFE